MSEELKPCPCCEGEPWDLGDVVVCKGCGLRTPQESPNRRELWNRRASPAPPTTEGREREALLAWMSFFADFWDGGSTEDCFDERELALKQLTLRALSPPDGDGKQEQATRASGPTAPTDRL